MEQEIADKNLLLAQSYARELDRFLGDSFRRQQHLANLLEKKPITLEGKFKNYFTTEVSGEDDLEMVRVLDKEGVVVYLTPFDQNILGLDMSRQDYCLAAKERQAPYWSNVFISPQTGRTTIALAIPYDQGMVVGHLSLSAVHEVIDSLNLVPGGYVAVLDRDGTAIAHFNHALVEQRANLSNHTHIAEGLRGHEGTFHYSINDQSHIGSVAVVARTKWVVTVSQPLAEIFLPIRNFIRILYAAIFIAVLMAVVVAVISIQRILSPLRRLTHDANKIAAGNYALAPVTTSYVEIAELSDSLKK